MITHKIQLNAYCAICPDGQIYLGTAGSHGNEHLKVIRGDGWKDLEIKVVFHPCGVSLRLPANGLLDIPWEATAVPLSAREGRIVFQGFNQDRLINSIDLHYIVSEHSITVGRDERSYTPGIVESVLSQLAADKADILAAANAAGQAYEEAVASASVAKISASRAAIEAIVAQQNASDSQVAQTQAAVSAVEAADHAAAAGKTLGRVETSIQQAMQQLADGEVASLNQIDDTTQKAVQQLEDIRDIALENIASAGAALPVVSSANAWQSVTVKPDGKGYNLANLAPCSAAICPTIINNPAVCQHSVAWAFQELKIYGKSIQDGVLNMENQVALVSAGDRGSIDVQVTGANLIRTHGTETINGVTFMDNGDGTITANGTATSTSNYFLSTNVSTKDFPIHKTTYYMHGCPSEGSTEKYTFQWFNPRGDNKVVYDLGCGAVVNVTMLDVEWNICISVKSGETVNNLVFKPMINYGKSALAFEPYNGLQSFTVSTPNGLLGVPVKSGGNCTDGSGQQWMSCYKDYREGKIYYPIKKYLANDVKFTLNSQWTEANEKYAFAYVVLNGSRPIQGAISNCFKTIPYTTNIKLINEPIIMVETLNNVSTVYFSILKSNLEELSGAAVKSYLNSISAEFIAANKNPNESDDINPEELAAYRALSTYNSTTVVSTTEDISNMEIQYIANGTEYLQSMNERIVALETV